jgi:hypothetical protein
MLPAANPIADQSAGSDWPASVNRRGLMSSGNLGGWIHDQKLSETISTRDMVPSR